MSKSWRAFCSPISMEGNKMYRIMLVAKEGSGEVNNLYKFFTVSNADGKIVPYEAETLETLDIQVEKMVNGDYRKKDILVVQTKGFDISSDLFAETVPDESDPDEPDTP